MVDSVRFSRARRAIWAVGLLAGMVAFMIWKYSPTPAPPLAARVLTPTHDRADVDFERSDVPLAPIAAIALATVALLALCAAVLMFAYPKALPDADRTVGIAPPGPRLQTDPGGDLRVFRAKEERRLNTYYWLDKQKGLVHIPIEQAMRQLAKTGIDGFPRGSP